MGKLGPKNLALLELTLKKHEFISNTQLEYSLIKRTRLNAASVKHSIDRVFKLLLTFPESYSSEA